MEVVVSTLRSCTNERREKSLSGQIYVIVRLNKYVRGHKTALLPADSCSISVTIARNNSSRVRSCVCDLLNCAEPLNPAFSSWLFHTPRTMVTAAKTSDQTRQRGQTSLQFLRLYMCINCVKGYKPLYSSYDCTCALIRRNIITQSSPIG